MQGIDLPEIAITSGGELVENKGPPGAFTLPDVAGVAVEPLLAPGNKCARCWQVLEEVGQSKAHPLLCHRCEEAVSS
jgi:isoleucyl-tRNA synthetase